MNELPADLAAPLHLVNPYPFLTALIWLALPLALWLLSRLWRRWRRRPRPVAPRPLAAAAPARVSAIEAAIQDIRQRYERADFRQGCHELSETLRSHFERSGRRALSTLTAREIAQVIGNSSVGSLFELLAELQFRRRRPSQEEFLGICDVAVQTVTPAEATGKEAS